jgi:hypothetical protein
MARLNWEGANRASKLNRRMRRESDAPAPVRRPERPPSERQLSYLQILCEQQGWRYTRPLTARQASARIKDLLALKKPST